MSARAWETRRRNKRWRVLFNKGLKKIEREGADYVMIGNSMLMSPAYYDRLMNIVTGFEKYLDSLPAE